LLVRQKAIVSQTKSHCWLLSKPLRSKAGTISKKDLLKNNTYYIKTKVLFCLTNLTKIIITYIIVVL